MLIVAAVFVNLLCAVLSILVDAPWYLRCLDAVILLSVTYFELRCWPGDITSNPHGLHQYNIAGKQVTFIAWNEVQTIEEGHEAGGPAADSLGLSTDILVVRGAEPAQTIIHTSRHPDRDRLRREFVAHKVSRPKA